MRAEALLRHFDVMADAPNGVKELRELILQLAVRGKLVPQDETEEPARMLLEQIAIQATKGAANPKLLPPITADETPHDTPDGWEWVRIGEAMNLVNGRAFKPTEWSQTGYPIVRIQNLNNSSAPFNYCAFAVPEKFHIDNGDLLLSWSGTPGTSFGAFVWQRGRAVLNQHIFRCDIRGGAYVNDFARLAINGRLDEMIARAHGGVGLQHVTKGKLDNLAIVLPPLGEQKRIVAKVEALMSRCDELEARQRRRVAARMRLNRSILHRVTAASSDETLAASWRQLHENFDLLYDTPETVAELRRTVGQLAVRGRLVPQEPIDEPASTILAQVALEQAQIVAMSKPGRLKASLPVAENDAPFALPEGWQWTRLGALIVDGPRNGYSPKPVDRPTATRALTLSATTTGVFSDRYFKHIDEFVPADSEYWLKPGDLLFQRGNSVEYVGIAAVYDGPANAFIYPDLMIRVRCSDAVDVRFVHLAANSFVGRAHFVGRASGTSGSMPKISQQDVRELPIPLPPLKEQRRIIAKVSQLMFLCDVLETRLRDARDRAAQFATSVIRDLTAA